MKQVTIQKHRQREKGEWIKDEVNRWIERQADRQIEEEKIDL